MESLFCQIALSLEGEGRVRVKKEIKNG